MPPALAADYSNAYRWLESQGPSRQRLLARRASPCRLHGDVPSVAKADLSTLAMFPLSTRLQHFAVLCCSTARSVDRATREFRRRAPAFAHAIIKEGEEECRWVANICAREIFRNCTVRIKIPGSGRAGSLPDAQFFGDKGAGSRQVRVSWCREANRRSGEASGADNACALSLGKGSIKKGHDK